MRFLFLFVFLNSLVLSAQKVIKLPKNPYSNDFHSIILLNNEDYLKDDSYEDGFKLYDIKEKKIKELYVFGNIKVFNFRKLKIKSAGAYGQVLSSNYNLRDTVSAVYSDETSLEACLQLDSEMAS